MDSGVQERALCVVLLFMQLVVPAAGAEGGAGAGGGWNITCPIMCACDYRESARYKDMVKIVDCSNKKLTLMPPNIPLDTQVLFLKGNVIPSIHGHLQRLTHLREVDLSHNRVVSLGDSHALFENLTSLRYLNLEGNQITTLRHGSFSGLKSLDDLLLSRNRIETIEEHAFGGLNHLQTLSLSHNRLGELKGDWFEGMANLNALQLDDNHLGDIEDAIFSPLPNLSVLSLARNRLRALRKFAFQGLAELQQINLDENRLRAVPMTALAVLRKLQVLSLNRNPIRKLSYRDLRDLPLLSDVSLCWMPELEVVDRTAFSNLPALRTLEMHSNERLVYLDYRSMERAPLLKLLYLHSNRLMALPYGLVNSLPALQVVSFHNNPVLCDCNVYWMAQLIGNGSNATTSGPRALTFQEPENIVCEGPVAMSARPLLELSAAELQPECHPTVIPFFNESNQVELGESVTYECRAIGVPEPHIHWILSNGKVLNNTSNFSRLKLETIGTLRVDHIKAMDSGTYTCIASNKLGYDTVNTVLRVHSKNIHILHKGVATNFITVTWNGTDATIRSSDYVILYRERDNAGGEYGKIHLRPYMRTYTITNLKPQTAYEFCIAYEHQEEQVKLNCVDIKTKSQMFVARGIKTLGNMTIIVALTITCMFIFALCVGTAVVRRYRRRKQYEEPNGCGGGNNQGVNQKVGAMSQIPLDHLCNPPSTPLCTSRTSLINSSQA